MHPTTQTKALVPRPMDSPRLASGFACARAREQGPRRSTLAVTAVFACVAAGFYPASARACAACFGQSDGPMAQGMNWGIFSLLGIVALVLGGVAGFFVFLARKSAAMKAPAGPLPEPAPQIS